MEVPLSRPSFNNLELEEIRKVLQSGWVSKGPEAETFEKLVADYVGVKNAIAVVNCTAALHLAYLSLGIREGDEVLVADFTFPATGHAVLYCQAKPVFVDVRPDTYNIDSIKIEECITEKTKAIVPVHCFGQSADMDSILKISRKNNLRVVEDAACALGATYKDKHAGSIGDIGCYSFHARKGITTGEGGMCVTNDPRLNARIRFLSVFGMESAWDRESSSDYMIPEFSDVGYNYKLSDILAAVGVVQMEKIERIIKRRQELARYWDQKLEDIEGIHKPYSRKDVRHIYQSYVCLLDSGCNRNKVITRLKNRGVQTQIGTYASHAQPVYKSKQRCPVSLDLMNRTLALPFYPGMQKKTIDWAAKVLKQELRECI